MPLHDRLFELVSKMQFKLDDFSYANLSLCILLKLYVILMVKYVYCYFNH